MAHQSISQTVFARTLRRKDNDAEGALWHELRGRRLSGFKFVREMPVGPYFADFACRAERLIVEVLEGRLTGRADTTGWRFWPRKK